MSATLAQPRVVLLVGARRTGSTLLGALLAACPGVVSVGELRLIWRWGIVRNHRCGCGRRFHSCDFWTAVLDQVLGTEWVTQGPRLVALHRAVDRVRHVPAIATPFLRSRSFQRDLSEYCDLLRRLYDAIASVACATIVADTSKSPSYALLLRHIHELDVDLLHLVRDSRAVACSWQAEKPVDAVSGVRLRREGPARVSAGWIASNVLGELLGCTTARYRRIAYEDLAARPVTELADLCSFLGLVVPAQLSSDGQFEMPVLHSIAGNAVQYQRGTIAIRVDERWRCDLKPLNYLVVTGVTLPFLHRYGYLARLPV